MKHFLLSYLLLSSAVNIFSQSEYLINDFSNEYFAKIVIGTDQNAEVFKTGKVIIFRKKDNVEILNVNSEKFEFDIQTDSNKNISYKDQNVIVYKDFNFDGENDLAIQDYFSSKGPSYTIYLYNKDSFQLDRTFTEIIQNSQGNYELDPASKTIQTMSSGGCCWHSFSTFIVKEGKPYPSREEVKESDLPFNINTTKEWSDGKMTVTIEKEIDLNQDGIIQIMSFKLLNKNKKVVLFNINNRTLNYALTDEKNMVEFNYPIKTVYRNPDFLLFQSGNELQFKNKGAEYKIYQVLKGNKIESIGIIVKFNGKETNLKGDIKTLKGSLKNIPNLDNVVKK